MKQPNLSEVPLFNKECNIWYFDQPYFIYNGHKFNIISTDISTGNVIHDVRLPNGVVIQMSTLDIVNKYKMLKSKEKIQNARHEELEKTRSYTPPHDRG